MDAAYQPSLWRVQKTAILLLGLAVLGPLPINAMLEAGPALHWQMANTDTGGEFEGAAWTESNCTAGEGAIIFPNLVTSQAFSAFA